MGLTPKSLTDVSQVLLVEDSPTEALLIHAVLEESDHPCFDVSKAGCLADAMAHLETSACDVVVLDLTLPDSSGLITFKRLHEAFPTVPVVVVTANANKDIALEAIQIGAQDYIVKEQVENMPLGLSLRFAMERQRADNEVKQQKQNLDTILQAAPVGMLVVDEQMIVRMSNHAVLDLVGGSTEDLTGKSLGHALYCRNISQGAGECGLGPGCAKCVVNQICNKVFHSGAAVDHTEIQFTFHRGEEERSPWLDICGTPVEISGQKHVILALNDITTKVEAEAIKARLMSMVSHELRSPLGAMKEATEIVLDELPGPLNDEQLRMLEIVKRNLLRLHRLTTDFLDLQKLKAGRMSFDMQLHDINQVVEEVRQTMDTAAAGKNVSVTVETADELPLFVFDKDRIEQVLINLVNNALKFTEAGSVTLVTTLFDSKVEIAVRDTGCGMDPNEIPHLFEEFKQLSNTKAGGTGLGLAIANKIVSGHQGKIEVASTLGEGTTVTVTLPLEQEIEEDCPVDSAAACL